VITRTYQTSKATQANGVTAQKEREAMWHALAVQHQQRLMMLNCLESINRKLDALLDIALSKGGLP
jgi:hypothetical protein